jgi:hypothetical protein
MFLVVIFGFLVVGIALVAYGTITKNRWGVNLGTVSCPRCKTPLAWVRKPRSIQQAWWGGYACPTCGADVDKWGRELQSCPKVQEGSAENQSFQESPPNGLFSRVGDLSAMTWVLGVILLALNFWFDYYHPIGFIFDSILLVSLCIWLLKLRNAGNHK